MKVSEIAKMKGITFEMVEKIFLDDYSTEDALRFWESEWKKVQATWLYWRPLMQLFLRKPLICYA